MLEARTLGVLCDRWRHVDDALLLGRRCPAIERRDRLIARKPHNFGDPRSRELRIRPLSEGSRAARRGEVCAG